MALKMIETKSLSAFTLNISKADVGWLEFVLVCVYDTEYKT